MLFRYLALLDRFSSDSEELDLSHEKRTLKIRKIPKENLEDFLLIPKHRFSTVPDTFEWAIALGEDMYWMDYSYEVEDSKQAMIRAGNVAHEEMEKVVLALRLFKEGCIRIIFNVRKVGRSVVSSQVGFCRSDERLYFVASSELSTLKAFHKEFADIAWERKETHTAPGIALNRFTDSYERLKPEDKIIDCMVGLEALYLEKEELGELSYRLAHRAAILLADSKKERQQLFTQTKKSYKLRSKIVHGLKYDLSPQDVWFVEDILRRSIKKFLKTPKPKWLDLIF